MILDHVADGTGRIVEEAAALDAEILRHGDLHALDMVAIPERLQKRIREAEVQHVMHRPLPEAMIDAESRRLVECAEQDSVELPR
jgi:predicted dinucleotide-utilizing enzyme